MKKAIIIPSNTDLNRGDQALVWESIKLVEDVYEKDGVQCLLMADIHSRDSMLQNKQTEKLGYRFIDTIVKHPGRKFTKKEDDSKSYTKLTMIQWGIQAIIDYLRTRPLMSKCSGVRKIGELFLNKDGKHTIAEIKAADSVFVKGGGFIHSYGAITDPYFIYYLTSTIRIAQAYGKKVIMFPNSIGPLKNTIAKSIAKSALKHCRLVTVRENISKQCLDSIGVDSTLYPDLGFFLLPSENNFKDYLKSKNIPLDQKKVVITLRPYRFQGFSNPTKLFSNYINGVICLIKHLKSKSYHITFMAHTLGPSSHEDDRIAIREVINHLPLELQSSVSYIEDFNLTCRDVEKIYSYYDYMIGTRFHSVIFSLNVGIPSIAIAYGGNKGKGIMNVLENSDYSIDMDKISDNSLIDMFDKLESGREDYLAKLSTSRRIINQRREDFIYQIRKVVGIK